MLAVRHGERFRRDFQNRPRKRCMNARDAHDNLSGLERTSPYESLRVVEEVVREFALFDLHGEGSSTRRTSGRRSYASPSDRTVTSDSSRNVAAQRVGTVFSFSWTGPSPSR